MAGESWKWSDAHFCRLPSQTNITTAPQTNVYSHAKILEDGGSNKVLVGSLAGKIMFVEYLRHFDNLIPTSREIQFTYIPADAELISLDVISKCTHGTGIIVGVTFMKEKETEENEKTCTQYLNIYSSYQPGEESFLDSIAQDCFSIDLDFVPYQLTHAEIFHNHSKETVFLLGGSDNKIHLYREVYQQNFREEPVEEFFPEFHNISSCVQWLDIVYYDNHTKRLSATGHQNGLVHVSVVDVTKTAVLTFWSVEHDSPVTSLRIFSPHIEVPIPSVIPPTAVKPALPEERSVPLFHLLVLSALEPAVVYRDILNHELKDRLSLPDSNKYDIPLCVCVMDIDFDGQNEILVGTYGQELLAYKLVKGGRSKTNSPERLGGYITETKTDTSDDSSRNRHRSCEYKIISELEEDPTKDTRKTKSQENIPSSVEQTDNFTEKLVQELKNQVDESSHGELYELQWQRSFACPVMGVDRIDILGDGMEDLVVVTLRGIHIIQPNLYEVAQVCSERLKLLTMDIKTTVQPEDDIDDQHEPEIWD